MKINKDKCKVLHPGKQNPELQHGLESAWMGRSFVEKALEVPVDNKFRMSDQCAVRGWAASTRASPAETGNSSTHSTEPAEWNSRARNGPSMQYHECQAWLYRKMWTGWTESKGQSPKMSKEGESLTWGKRLRELGMFSLEKRGPGGDSFTMFQYLKDGNKDQTPSLQESFGKDEG